MIRRRLFRDRRGVRRPMLFNPRGTWTMALFAVVALALAVAGTPR